MIPKSKMPHFFYDDDTASFEAEIMIDFFISWTLRCSVEEYKQENELVQEYSKSILLFLLGDKLKGVADSDIFIKKVNTWKQWERIDLIVDIELEVRGVKQEYVIVFENKLYTHIHDNKLDRYAESINLFYNKSNNKEGFEKVFIFLTASDEVSDEDKEACEQSIEKYRPLTVFELRNSFGDMKQTGHDLFDEFWFRYFFYDKSNS